MTDEREPECSCGEPDVYDGWAECEAHPEVVSAPNERHHPPLAGPLPRLRLVK